MPAAGSTTRAQFAHPLLLVDESQVAASGSARPPRTGTGKGIGIGTDSCDECSSLASSTVARSCHPLAACIAFHRWRDKQRHHRRQPKPQPLVVLRSRLPQIHSDRKRAESTQHEAAGEKHNDKDNEQSSRNNNNSHNSARKRAASSAPRPILKQSARDKSVRTSWVFLEPTPDEPSRTLPRFPVVAPVASPNVRRGLHRVQSGEH